MYDIKLYNGHKVCNGTFYNIDTPDAVIQRLERARLCRFRIRIFYGDAETGHDWLELHDTIGYIGRSAGPNKIPLMINNTRSHGGFAIFDNRIMKITVDRETVYKHKNYKTPEFTIKETTRDGAPWYELYESNCDVPCFCNDKRANVENEISFFKGLVNRHKYN